MLKKSKNPIRHVAGATGVSIRGLQAAFRCELAFRLEVTALVVCLPLAFWLGKSAVERSLLVLSLLAIPMIELINSAIESTVDRIGPERHELSGRAKDLGSAAVLMAIIAAAAIWGMIAWERFG